MTSILGAVPLSAAIALIVAFRVEIRRKNLELITVE